MEAGAGGQTTTWDEVITRARAIVPVLRERADRAEQLRRVPDETIDDFRDAGFYRVLQPARYGGMELDYGIQTELAIELGRGCGSSAWDASITARHAWLAGMFPPEAQDEVWADDPETMVSTSFLPIDPRIEPVDGGLRVSGRWRFSSGVDHCGWSLLTFALELDDGRGDEHIILVRLADCGIEDTWFSTRLAGTGSNDIVLEDHFVPDRRVMRTMDLRGGPTPGSAVNPGYLYQLPLHGVFSFNPVGTALGVARGAVEGVIEELKGRAPVTRANLADLQSVRLRVSEAQAELDAAYALIARDREEIARDGKAGIIPDVARRVRYRRDNSFAAMLSVRAVDRVLPLLGGRGLVTGHPVQRAWRDVHAAAHHVALTWDIQGVAHGAMALGQPCPDPRI